MKIFTRLIYRRLCLRMSKKRILSWTQNIHEMTQKELRAIPRRKWDEDIGLFDCVLILPEKVEHDSGYACMSFILCRGNEPVCKVGGGSDVIHIDGIGGYGDAWEKTGAIPTLVPCKSWSIDCLYKSKVLRLFVNGYKLRAGDDLSSFEIVAVKKEGA